ncbi:hypothetical protein PssB301D_00340 [Pseudomonas syringae pv. syringae str. B301D-R]|nr:hypothetical protein PssB301D_00340 [Pseudomonas syringae pv. syringae str. B301D-R]
MFGACVDVQQGIEQGADGQGHEQDGERHGDVADHVPARSAQARDQREAELNDQRRHHLRQAMENLVVAEVVDPVQGRLTAEHPDGVQHQKARHAAKHQCGGQQQDQGQPGAYPRVLIEHVPEFLGLEPKRVNIHKSIGPVERRGGRD